MGGALLSCPRCGSGNLNIRQNVAEELLMTELDRNRLVFCPYKVNRGPETSLDSVNKNTYKLF